MKTCTKCKTEKLESDFYEVRRKNKPIKLTARCKKCTCEDTAYSKKSDLSRESSKRASMRWKQQNLERVKNKELERVYGISLDQYNAMLLVQEEKCAICEKEFANNQRRNLYVDHCHISGKVRGLLCQKCNQGLGLFDDNISFLEKAVSYLQRNKNE
jgi:23S rRNA G2069 N7-methylase RlmK/C1962 C5-methylase RlmI